MPSLSRRSTETELMDDPGAPANELRQNLRELEVVNMWLGGYRVILGALQQLRLPANGPLSIMDLGSGGGDTLRAVAKWARQQPYRASLTGIDWNPVMTAYAREHSAAYPEIKYRTVSIFDAALNGERADVVMCSLFCHHFEQDALVQLLQRMRQLAGKAVIINDLHRHWLAYHAIAVLTALFSRTYMVKHDAKLSVARAFRRPDWVQVLQAAGIRQYSLRWRWAFRWELIIPAQDADPATAGNIASNT